MTYKVKRVWRVDEEPVNLTILSGVLGPLVVEWRCPECKGHKTVDADEACMYLECPCGQRVHVHLRPTLEEL